MTGAANPRRLYEQAELELVRARRYRRPLSLAYFDLDDFKMINDTYGHQVGNMLLMEIARRITGAIRANDLLARMGGEEFALLMPETDLAQANRAMEKIASLVRNLILQKDLTVSFSFGLATFVNPPDSVAEMIHRADMLLYRAKSQGKNKLVAEEFFKTKWISL